MNIEKKLVEKAIEFSAEYVFDKLKLKLEAFAEENKIKDICEKDIVDLYSKYLIKTYKSREYMNGLVTGSEQKLLKDLYYPLSLQLKGAIGSCEKELICVDSNCIEKLKSYSNILICDSAGMGKSTILNYLFLNIVESGEGIPFFIELRDIVCEDEESIYAIRDKINSILVKNLDKKFSQEQIDALIKRGEFILILDGYDEVESNNKKIIAKEIMEISNWGNNNIIFLSSREEEDLVAFNTFQKFSIKEMTIDEAFELIKKYGQDDDISKELIEHINKDKNLEIIKEFLKNPLMTAMLYRAYKYKRKIPYKKYLFYEQVYNAIFEEHDLSKVGYRGHEKKSKLEVDDFLMSLSVLGFYLTFVIEKNSFTKMELLEYIENAKELMPRENDFDNKAFFYDITVAVPFFRKDGVEYKCIHKSFLEYFSAYYITKCLEFDRKKELLYNLAFSKNNLKYFNILDFIYDMDENIFNEVVTKGLCEKYLEFYRDLSEELGSNNEFIANLLLGYEKIFIRKMEENEWDEIEKHVGHDRRRDKTISFMERTGTTSATASRHKVISTKEDVKIQILFKESENVNLINLLKMKKHPLLNDTMLADKTLFNVKVEMLETLENAEDKIIDCKDIGILQENKLIIEEFLKNNISSLDIRNKFSNLSKPTFNMLTKQKCNQYMKTLSDKQNKKAEILSCLKINV